MPDKRLCLIVGFLLLTPSPAMTAEPAKKATEYSALLTRLETLKIETQIAKEQTALLRAQTEAKALLANKEADKNQDIKSDLFQKRLELLEQRLKQLSAQKAKPEEQLPKENTGKAISTSRILSVQSSPQQKGGYCAIGRTGKGSLVQLRPGSRWNGGRIRSISKDSVTITYPNGKKQVVRF